MYLFYNRTPSNGKLPFKADMNIIKIYFSHNFFLTFCYNFVTTARIIRGEIKFSVLPQIVD